MFGKLAKSLTQMALGAIVVLLSVVFALQFGGPQAEGCSSNGAAYGAKILGTTVTEGEFDAGYVMAGFDRYPPATAQNARLREILMDGLVERTLLAKEARELGLDVTEDEAMAQLARTGKAYLSLGVDAPPHLASGAIALPVMDSDDVFDKEAARRFIQYRLRRSVAEFAKAQVEETLAHRMRQWATLTVAVSPQEVWDAYVRETETVTLRYVRFVPSDLESTVPVDDEAVAIWSKGHPKELQEEYERKKYRYTGLGEQVRARHILVAVASDATDADKTAGRKRAEALLARVRRGEDFATLARTSSEDELTAPRGGDLGYNPKGRLDSGLEETLFAMEVGQVSDVLESPKGLHILKVEDLQEGDVPMELAKAELATNLFVQDQAREKANAFASSFLEQVKTGSSFDDAATALEDGMVAVTVTQAFGRGGTPVAGEQSAELVKIAFELSEESPLHPEVFSMDADLLVMELKDRAVADANAFSDEDRSRLERGLLSSKRRETVRLFVEELRERAEDKKGIKINPVVLAYGDA